MTDARAVIRLHEGASQLGFFCQAGEAAPMPDIHFA
jgi:hypothetical protein